MSAGPATKMRETFGFIAAHSQAPTAIRSAAERVVMDLTPATLEAMDAAAEVMGARHPEEAAFPLRCRDDGEGLYIRDRNLDYYFLHPAEQAQLLRKLFTRFIQRRKEAGNG